MAYGVINGRKWRNGGMAGGGVAGWAWRQA